MKVVFYIASSINGCIADKDGNTNWSTEDNESYLSMCQKTGAVVMGRKTYDEYLKLSDTDWPNPHGPTVVLTSKSSLPQNKFETHLADSPIKAIEVLEKLGKKEIVVIGGNRTWTSFLGGD